MSEGFLVAAPELHVPCTGDRAAIMSLVHELLFAFQDGLLNEEDWLNYFYQFKTYQSLCKKIDHLYKLYEEIPWYRFINKIRMKKRLIHAENSEEKEFLFIRHLGILMRYNIRIKYKERGMITEDELPWPLNHYKEAGIKITKIYMRKMGDKSPLTHVVSFVIGKIAIFHDLNRSLMEYDVPPKEIFWAEWDGESSTGKKENG